MVLFDFFPDWTRQLRILTIRNAKSTVASDYFDFSEFLRIVDWKAPQAHSVEQFEDGGVCSDPQCQRNNHHQRESGIQSQLPQCIPQTLESGHKIFNS